MKCDRRKGSKHQSVNSGYTEQPVFSVGLKKVQAGGCAAGAGSIIFFIHRVPFVVYCQQEEVSMTVFSILVILAFVLLAVIV